MYVPLHLPSPVGSPFQNTPSFLCGPLGKMNCPPPDMWRLGCFCQREQCHVLFLARKSLFFSTQGNGMSINVLLKKWLQHLFFIVFLSNYITFIFIYCLNKDNNNTYSQIRLRKLLHGATSSRGCMSELFSAVTFFGLSSSLVSPKWDISSLLWRIASCTNYCCRYILKSLTWSSNLMSGEKVR